MKVFVRPPQHMSLAMFRVADVIARSRPEGVELVANEDDADLLILHVIGLDAINYRTDKPCAVLQYCVNTGSDVVDWWQPLWQRARAIWSYYDLRAYMPAGARFYHAPLGVSENFTRPFEERTRDVGVFTSGYVTGPGAEAIEEAVVACARVGRPSLHLGPRPVGMSEHVKCNSTRGFIPDDLLAAMYQRTRYVSGLRFVEGFELPALEGLACGARPIMFDRPDAHQWFDAHAVFVPECHGEELTEHLVKILATDPEPVSAAEHWSVAAKFNWEDLTGGFWKMIMEAV
jgi:hypothetical protein